MDIHKARLWQGRRGLVPGLVSLGILLNYADRQIIAVLKPMLQRDLGWTDGEYGRMTSAFQFATAFSFLGDGRLGERTARAARSAGRTAPDDRQVAARTSAALSQPWAAISGKVIDLPGDGPAALDPTPSWKLAMAWVSAAGVEGVGSTTDVPPWPSLEMVKPLVT